MSIIITIIELLIIITIVATIHEFGHFLFAKLFHMTVEEFSIGFGKKIFQKEYKGTKYSLRLIPFARIDLISVPVSTIPAIYFSQII